MRHLSGTKFDHVFFVLFIGETLCVLGVVLLLELSRVFPF